VCKSSGKYIEPNHTLERINGQYLYLMTKKCLQKQIVLGL